MAKIMKDYQLDILGAKRGSLYGLGYFTAIKRKLNVSCTHAITKHRKAPA